MKTPYYSTKVIKVIFRLIYDVNFATGLWCQFCHHIIMSGILFWIRLVHDVNLTTSPWCPFCHHIITSGILFWIRLVYDVNFAATSSRRVSCFDWNLFVLSLIWVNQKNTLKSLFPILHWWTKYWELLIIKCRFVIIKNIH